MAIAVVLLWLAALSAFLSSKQQNLIEKRLSKLAGWGLFCALSFLGWLFFLGTYSGLTALFLAMSYLMAAWIAIVFVLGHYNPSLWQVGSVGALISVLVFYMGML